MCIYVHYSKNKQNHVYKEAYTTYSTECFNMKLVDILLVVFSTALDLATSQSLPHFKGGTDILKNNSIIPYSSIVDGVRALKCVTDSINCCNDSDVGNWRDERGRAVHQGEDEATCLYVTRGQGVISLNRKGNCIPDTSGLWRCDIPDSSEVMQSLYIYISNDTTSGKLIALFNVSIISTVHG